MKSIPFRHVNAFTDQPFGGNPAGVVLNARGLSDKEMQKIAREINLSETAFVLPASVKTADLRIRWFTPAIEVPLCGHATIAAFSALADEAMCGMTSAGTYRFRLQTKSGILGIEVEKRHSGTVIEFQLPAPKFRHLRRLAPRLLGSLGIRSTDLHKRLPVVAQSYLYVPLKRRDRLKSLEPDFAELKRACDAMHVLGVSLFVLDPIEKSSAFHSRFYAPSAGIDEDPVTGSANGPLGAYVYQYAHAAGYTVPSLVMGDGRIEYIGEQGDLMGRKGRVKVRVKGKKHGVASVAIAGEAVTFFKSDLHF
ncbi:MAG: PhzF family phenazine biosynthesis protein [Ignavibacteria bacterium]|nr:PhzF family phenazine biosynthesis protein [Ignavibacteria bacterium]